MVIVWIPALLRDLTQGKDKIHVSGSTIREVIDNLNSLYPGFKDRLFKDEKLRPDITVLIDGEMSYDRLRQKVFDNNEVFFVPTIAGGG